MAGLFQAQIEPSSTILALPSHTALHSLNFLRAAFGAADDAIRPAHLLEILKAILILGELRGDLSDVHEPKLSELAICVK